MSKRDERIKRMQAQQVKQVEQAEKAPQESWFSDMFGNYDKRLQALPESNPLRQIAQEPALASESPSQFSPMSQVLDRNELLGTGEEYLQGPVAVDRPVAPIAPIQRKPVRDIRANPKAPSLYPSNVPERMPLTRRGMPMAQQRAPLSAYNIMDADLGTDGRGINW